MQDPTKTPWKQDPGKKGTNYRALQAPSISLTHAAFCTILLQGASLVIYGRIAVVNQKF